MIKLDATTKTLEIDLTSAVTTNQLTVYASYSDISQSTFALTGSGSSDTASNDTTAVTIVSAPAASTTRKVDLITVYNADTVSAEVTIQLNNNSTLRTIVKQTLWPDETLQYADGEGWSVVNKKKGVKSSLNSTSSTLLAAGTFTGTAETNDYGYVFGSVYADVAGTMYFDFSTNGGSNYDSTLTFVVSAGINEFQPVFKGNRTFRMRYVNGSSNQSTFRAGVYFQDEIGFIASPSNLAQGLDASAISTRSGFPWLEYARNLRSGVLTYKKFGRVISASAGSFSPVALGSVYNTPQSGSATTLRVKAGGNANDTAAGSGAREVTLTGLDENFDLVSEAVATAGASASSATTTTFTRLMFIDVTASGTYATASAGSHSAAITIENGAGGTDWGLIDATVFPKGRSEIGAFSCPRNYTAHVFLTNFSADTGKTIDLVFFSRTNIDETSAPYTAMQSRSVHIGLNGGQLGVFGSRQVPLGAYTGPCDFGFMVNPDTSAADVSVEFEIFLVNE